MNYGVKLCAVVKADAYGHGMLKTVEKINSLCDYFAVATAAEALALRKLCDTDILLFGYFEKSDLQKLLNAKINLTVFDTGTLKALNSFAKKYNEKFYIHIKFDCGMNRLGYKKDSEGVELLKTLKFCNNIILNGFYTHFPSGDLTDRKFLLLCKNKFEKEAALFKNFKNDIIIHAAASPTAFIYLNLQYDMVRIGLNLYGCNANDDTNSHLKLYPALELKAKILQTKTVEKNETVGYGRNFTAINKMKLAIIACGYADGYSRLLSNSGVVVIDNLPCKICGNVCMDLLMADCSNCKTFKEAILLSENEFSEYIGLEKIAKDNNTIVYEVLTSFSNRIERIYVNG